MAFTATPKGNRAFYTIDDINSLFSAVADEINSKLGVDELDVVKVEAAEVFVGGQLVVVGGKDFTLTGTFGVNGKKIINMLRGVSPQDAITLAQAKEILGV